MKLVEGDFLRKISPRRTQRAQRKRILTTENTEYTEKTGFIEEGTENANPIHHRERRGRGENQNICTAEKRRERRLPFTQRRTQRARRFFAANWANCGKLIYLGGGTKTAG